MMRARRGMAYERSIHHVRKAENLFEAGLQLTEALGGDGDNGVEARHCAKIDRVEGDLNSD